MEICTGLSNWSLDKVMKILLCHAVKQNGAHSVKIAFFFFSFHFFLQ